MRLNELSKHWDSLAREDPMWAILSDPVKKGGKWEPQEFFASGRVEINQVMEHVGRVQPLLRRGRALDFGCGLGRLTQALAGYFDEVVGVDIAPAMIAGAERYNAIGDRCRYVLNPRSDLGLFESGDFDFVYSNLVLQHMHPKYGASYIQEFIRVLAPGGVVLFQVPSRLVTTFKGLLFRVIPRRVLRLRYKMDMFCTPKEDVISLVQSTGAHVETVEANKSSGAIWESFRYTVIK